MGAMEHRTSHERCVDAWLAKEAADLVDARDVLFLLARGMQAIRLRSEQTLGRATVSAIFDRVLASSSDIDTTARDRDEALDATRRMLVDTLGLLSTLTGDALTASLHTALDATTDRMPPPPHSRASRKRGLS
jgi:hypothetical protein